MRLKSDGLSIEIREEPTGSGNYIIYIELFPRMKKPRCLHSPTSIVSPLGEYTFTLLEATDHTPVQGNNDLNIQLASLRCR
ncbi:hypothetical protein O9993_17945 [Vibrio lentus]|nr:hypothetical protein [Vibrio lentus]